MGCRWNGIAVTVKAIQSREIDHHIRAAGDTETSRHVRIGPYSPVTGISRWDCRAITKIYGH